MKKFGLSCWVSNGGDGSANPRFEVNHKKAQETCDSHSEKGDGWAENSARRAIIVVDDNGNLFLEETDGKLVDGEYKVITTLIPLEEVEEKKKKKRG